MTQLVDSRGNPLSSAQFERTRGRPPLARPAVGETAVAWGGDKLPFLALPDGGRVVLDPSALSLEDFRVMKTHYQINSSLTVLTFMMHQLDYSIEASNSKVKSGIEYAMDKVWTRLVRAMSTSFWAGFSPNALQWENDPSANMLVINKVKDLTPEYCTPAYREVEAAKFDPQDQSAVKPTSRIFDGIHQQVGGLVSGNKYHIPVTNSFWYPLLMENGDMFGSKLLKSAYAPWFFSNMIHAYANSYYERFGEPVPVARAPYGDKITVEGNDVDSALFMQGALRLLRSGAAVVLPNDRDRSSSETGKRDYEYDIEYLESQMRGADFEKHLSRLDEEMSLALFTPLLLMRTSETGGYNQAVSQTQIYLWQLNALASDWKEYIDKYVIAPLVKYNYGGKQWAKIKFRKMGTTQQETVRAIIQEQLRSGSIKVDTEELGFAAGLTIEQVDEIVQPDNGGDSPQQDKRIGRPEKLRDDDPKSIDKQKTTTKALSAQVDRVKYEIKQMVERRVIERTDTWPDNLVVHGASRSGAEKFSIAARCLAVDAVTANDFSVVESSVDHLQRKYL